MFFGMLLIVAGSPDYSVVLVLFVAGLSNILSSTFQLGFDAFLSVAKISI